MGNGGNCASKSQQESMQSMVVTGCVGGGGSNAKERQNDPQKPLVR